MSRARLAILLALAVLAGVVWSARRGRDIARAEAAHARAEARAPVLFAGGRSLANDGALFRLVADTAAATGVRLSLRPVIDPPAPGLIALDLDGTAPEPALRAFAQGLEGGRPLIRLVRWSIADAGGGQLRLTARAAAPVATESHAVRIVLSPAPDAPPVPVGHLLFAADAPADLAPQRAGAPPRLIGIVGPAGQPLAMVRAGEGAVRTLAIGEVADGWTLTATAVDRATFRRGRDERVSVLPAKTEEQAPQRDDRRGEGQ